MKKKRMFIMLLFLAGVFSACTKEKDLLIDNKWQLVGFVDVSTGEMKEPESTNEYCYTLTFKKNRKWEGRSAANSIQGKYNVNYSKHSINISIGTTTKKGCEYCDEELYIESLPKIDSFSLQENELKLYYNNKQNYLLFKSQGI